jgi:hypothetical protein
MTDYADLARADRELIGAGIHPGHASLYEAPDATSEDADPAPRHAHQGQAHHGAHDHGTHDHGAHDHGHTHPHASPTGHRP